jgi:adenylate cyclase class 1
MAYAMRNHILTRSNLLSVNDERQRVSTIHAVELATQLSRALQSTESEETPLTAPPNSDTIAGLELYVNLEHQPTTILSKQGLNLSSNLNDPLNYSSYNKSMVLTIDGIIRLHDGQWQSIQLSGEDVVLSLLKQVLLWRPQTQFNIQCWCPTAIYGHAISDRLRTLINSTVEHYMRFPDRGRLLINIAQRAYKLQWHGNVVEHVQRPPQQEIWRVLANLHHAFTATYIDRYLDKDQLFNTLLNHQAPDRVNVFFYAEAQTIICYVLDEFGNLVKQQFQKMKERTLLAHLQQFLGEIQTHHGLAGLQFFRLTHYEQAWHLTPLSPPSVPHGYLPIKVMMSQFSPQAQCTVMCGDKWYEGQANDVALFQKVRDYVLSLRSSNQAYPIYLNSLRFSDNKHYPAAFYVQQKQRLEKLFDPAS